jgi:hypothetical protein
MRLASVCLFFLLTIGAPPAAAQPATAGSPPAAAPDGARAPDRGFFADAAIVRYALRSETIDGDGAAPMLALGYQVNRRFSVRVETAMGAPDFDRTRHARFTLRPGSPGVEAAIRQMSREELERLWPETDLHVSRDVRFVTSALAGAHADLGSRVRLALVGGLTFQAERSVEEREDPTLLDLTPTYQFDRQTTSWSRTQVLLATGFDVAVRLAPHVSVVPQLRFDFGKDANDPDDWITIVRPGVSIRWVF